MFFEEHLPAIKIAESIRNNLSDSEKDQVNVRKILFCLSELLDLK